MYRECPVCCSKQKKYLYNYSINLPKDYKLPNNYFVVSCNNCGTCYADYDIRKCDYDDYYKNHNSYSNRSSKDSLNDIILNDIIRIFKTYVDKESSIIDIGAGNGLVLKYLQTSGYNNLFGIDPSVESVQVINELGIKASVGSIYDEKIFLKQKFDIICTVNVLEHLENPILPMKNVKKMLKPGGKLFIIVPNFDYIDKSLNPISLHFHHEHINYFSRHSLVELMKNAGLSELLHFNREFYKGMESLYYEIFQMNDSVYSHEKDKVTYKKIKKYINKNKDILSGMKQTINNIANSDKKYVIWGVGSLTFTLASNTNLLKCNVLAIVDGNITKQGKYFSGFEIENPSTLKEVDEDYKILISTNSQMYVEQIIYQIKDMGINKPIIDLLNNELITIDLNEICEEL